MCYYVLITDALPSQSYVTYTLKVLYTINLFFSYPLMISPAINLLEGYIFNTTSKPTKGRYWMQNLFRSMTVAFTIVVALCIYKYISLFIDVVAAATCSPLAFSLPAIFHYKLMGQNKWHLFICIVTVALAVFMVVQAIYELTNSIISPEENVCI